MVLIIKNVLSSLCIMPVQQAFIDNQKTNIPKPASNQDFH